MQRRAYRCWHEGLIYGYRDACHYFSFKKCTYVRSEPIGEFLRVGVLSL